MTCCKVSKNNAKAVVEKKYSRKINSFNTELNLRMEKTNRDRADDSMDFSQSQEVSIVGSRGNTECCCSPINHVTCFPAPLFPLPVPVGAIRNTGNSFMQQFDPDHVFWIKNCLGKEKCANLWNLLTSTQKKMPKEGVFSSKMMPSSFALQLNYIQIKAFFKNSVWLELYQENRNDLYSGAAYIWFLFVFIMHFLLLPLLVLSDL